MTLDLPSMSFGFLSSLAITSFFFYIQMYHPHYWHRLRFRKKKNSDYLLSGKASLLHSLKGKQRSFSQGGAATDETVTLGKQFPAPEEGDALEYDLENVSIIVNPSNETLFEGTMKYLKSGETKTADIKGTGNFVYKDEKNFDGFVALNCEMTEARTQNEAKLTWTVSCILRRDPETKNWDGFWFLFDRQIPRYANFGTIELNQAPQATVTKAGYLRRIFTRRRGG